MAPGTVCVMWLWDNSLLIASEFVSLVRQKQETETKDRVEVCIDQSPNIIYSSSFVHS